MFSSTSAEICRSPLNNSTAKMQYSFPKNCRFKSNKQNMDRPYYQISTSGSKRATNFGYGTKYDFTKDMPKTPPPGFYQASSVFEKQTSAKKGCSFGNGRQNMVVTGPLAETRNNKNPGPGSYQLPSSKNKTFYSIKGKTRPQTSDSTPGPGNYQIRPTLNNTGTNFFSKFKDQKARLFSSSTDRFKKSKSEFPGPGNYNTSNIELNTTGKYSLSKMQNAKVRSFGNSIRKSLNEKNETPGPGNYRLPSDFGYYVDIKHSRQRPDYTSPSTHKKSQSRAAQVTEM